MTATGLPRRRRRTPGPCLVCTTRLTRHPSRICRDCRIVVGDTITNYSTAIEKGTQP